LPVPQQINAVVPPAQVLDELEALEVQDEAGGRCTYLDAPLRLLVAATRLTLELVALGQHLSLAVEQAGRQGLSSAGCPRPYTLQRAVWKSHAMRRRAVLVSHMLLLAA
jgi:hypothetical protein